MAATALCNGNKPVDLAGDYAAVRRRWSVVGVAFFSGNWCSTSGWMAALKLGSQLSSNT